MSEFRRLVTKDNIVPILIICSVILLGVGWLGYNSIKQMAWFGAKIHAVDKINETIKSEEVRETIDRAISRFRKMQ